MAASGRQRTTWAARLSRSALARRRSSAYPTRGARRMEVRSSSPMQVGGGNWKGGGGGGASSEEDADPPWLPRSDTGEGGRGWGDGELEEEPLAGAAMAREGRIIPGGEPGSGPGAPAATGDGDLARALPTLRRRGAVSESELAGTATGGAAESGGARGAQGECRRRTERAMGREGWARPPRLGIR